MDQREQEEGNYKREDKWERERERVGLWEGGLITSLPQKFLVLNYHPTLKVPPIFHLAPKIA